MKSNGVNGDDRKRASLAGRPPVQERIAQALLLAGVVKDAETAAQAAERGLLAYLLFEDEDAQHYGHDFNWMIDQLAERAAIEVLRLTRGEESEQDDEERAARMKAAVRQALLDLHRT